MNRYAEDLAAARKMLHLLAVACFLIGAYGVKPFRMLLVGLALWCVSRVGR